MIDEADLMEHIREWDSKYGPTYLVLDLLQKVFYTSDAARESFVELCEEEYVQKVTFDSYLYKTVQGNAACQTSQTLVKVCRSLVLTGWVPVDSLQNRGSLGRSEAWMEDAELALQVQQSEDTRPHADLDVKLSVGQGRALLRSFT